VPLTFFIAAVNIVLLPIMWIFQSLWELSSMQASEVWHGQVWRLFTYAWVHTGFLHCIGNMLVFVPFGLYIEYRWGRARLVAVYLLGCLGSGIVLLIARQPAVGASGAVAAVLALWLAGVLAYRRKKWYLMLPELALGVLVGVFFIARQLVGDLFHLFANDNVAHWGHLGGFGTGYLVFRAGLLTPRARKRDQSETDPDP